MHYLKIHQYYVDLYDLFTVKDCLRAIEFWRKAYWERSNDEKIKDLPQEEKEKGFQYILNQELFVIKAQRYKNKKQRIREMLEDDKKKQDFYDKTPEPSNIHCDTCGDRLISETKILEDYMDQPMKVLFFFPCKKCKTKKAIYNTGEIFESKPRLCPKCNSELIEKHKVSINKKHKVITWTRNCSSCKFSEEEIDDFDKSHAEFEKRQEEDKKLLEKYRSEFCLSEKEGEEALETIEKIKYANKAYDEEIKKFDTPTYSKVMQLKKLSIVELEKHLTKLLEENNFIKLSFDNPEINQHVIVPFTVQDSEEARKEYKSTFALEKLIKEALTGTNWRLMSNSVSYRLGFLSGRLKGYEREEDFWELSGKKKELEKPVSFDERSKYEGDNMVQLARLLGKSKAEDNLRRKRLEAETEGFFLEGDGIYSCGICGESTPGNRTWWDLSGVRCSDCQRNVKEGVIPKKVLGKKKGIVKEWEFQAYYSIHPATRKKWEREGKLKGRNFKRSDGTTYCTIYLKDENKEFFETHPEKPKMKIEWKMTDDKGKEVKM